jgi:glycosyltransferase involved in cell wall biosynthesis
VVLTAYANLFHLGALRAARKLGAKVVMRHEASDKAQVRSGFKGAIRDFVLKCLYNRIDRFAAIGTEARRHLVRLGVSEDRIGFSPYCVDSDFLKTQKEHWQPKRIRLRCEIGARREDVVFVFAGKLITKKDPLLIIAACKLLPPELRERVHLLVAGDGELKADLEVKGRAVLGPRLHLLGFLNQSEIGRAYTMADVLILPSRRGEGETWGLVVNEAMQFNLPAIVSDGVGCGPDLVQEQETGCFFPTGDAKGLAQAMTRFCNLSSFDRVAMGEKSQIRVKRFSLDEAALGMSELVFSVVARQMQANR